jgi:hypothetical protein
MQKCLIGGLGQNTTLVRGTQQDVDAQVKDAWTQVGRCGLILGPGCVASLDTSEANLLQLVAQERGGDAATCRPRCQPPFPGVG